MSKETCLVPSSDEEKPVANSYNFVTECFFMGHRAFDLSFRVSVDKLVRLNQEIVRLERAYNDAMNQAGVMNNDIVDTLKSRLNSELAR